MIHIVLADAATALAATAAAANLVRTIFSFRGADVGRAAHRLATGAIRVSLARPRRSGDPTTDPTISDSTPARDNTGRALMNMGQFRPVSTRHAENVRACAPRTIAPEARLATPRQPQSLAIQ
jgi:hypothetical protein